MKLEGNRVSLLARAVHKRRIPMSDETGAEVLTRLVIASGIDVCFANPGTTEMHLVDALSADERVRYVCCSCKHASSPFCVVKMNVHQLLCYTVTGPMTGHNEVKLRALVDVSLASTRQSALVQRMATQG